MYNLMVPNDQTSIVIHPACHPMSTDNSKNVFHTLLVPTLDRNDNLWL